MSKKRIVLGFAFILFLVLFVSIVFSAPSVQKCVEEHGRDDYTQQCDHLATRMFILVSVYTRCVGTFLNTYSNGLTAIATMIIAAFTATLWFTSKRQWETSREQIRILEQQMIFEHGPRIRVVEAVLIGELEIDKPIKVAVSLINTGASDATIVGGNLTVTVGEINVAPWRRVDSEREVSDPYQPPFDFFVDSAQGSVLEAGMQTLPFAKERHLYLQPLEAVAI